MSLQSGTGLDVIKQMRQAPGSGEGTRTKILVHSMYEESVYAERVLQAGANGYVNKAESPDVLLTAIRRILSGKVYLSPQMTDRILERSIGQRPQACADPIQRLTDRELEIFRMIGEAHATREIAEQLFLSVNTVETHRSNIKKKLGISNGPELNQRAVQWVLENG